MEERGLAWKRWGWRGRKGIGVEESGLTWKRGSWSGREGIGVESRELEWKRGDWREREGIVVEERELAWKRGLAWKRWDGVEKSGGLGAAGMGVGGGGKNMRDLKEKLSTLRSLCGRDRERPVGREGVGMEDRGLAWKRRDWRGREGLACKRGDRIGGKGAGGGREHERSRKEY